VEGQVVAGGGCWGGGGVGRHGAGVQGRSGAGAGTRRCVELDRTGGRGRKSCSRRGSRRGRFVRRWCPAGRCRARGSWRCTRRGRYSRRHSQHAARAAAIGTEEGEHLVGAVGLSQGGIPWQHLADDCEDAQEHAKSPHEERSTQRSSHHKSARPAKPKIKFGVHDAR